MTIREGRWDCQYCGTKGILGRHKSCPVCATSRPAGTKFYLPDNAEAVTDQERLGYAQAGPDWICEFCGTSNGAGRKVCRSCFADRGTKPQTQQVKRYDKGGAPASGDMSFQADPQPLAMTARESDTEVDIVDRLQEMPRWLVFTIGILALAAVGALAINASRYFTRSTVEVQVQSYEWERSIDIEAYETVIESDWTIPAGGRVISESQEIHHFDQVLVRTETRSRQVSEQVQVGQESYVCGQQDLGNGFFQDVMCSQPVYETRFRTETYEEPIFEPVPIYQTKYGYEIEKWVFDRRETASGRTRDAAWPTLNLAENEREGETAEAYFLTVRDPDGETYRMELPFIEWANFREGTTYQLELNGFGEPLELK